MEVSSGVVLKTIPCYSGQKTDTQMGKLGSLSTHVCFRRPSFRELKFRAMGKARSFEDQGHLDYYMVSCGKGKGKGMKGWNGVSTKKKMKLLKGLVKDLSMFSELGFGLDDDQGFGDQGLDAGDDKSKIISQAAETLLAQLKQLTAEEEKTKKTEKLEKQKCKSMDCESSSSSSSESSSDSECDDEVVDMARFRDTKAIVQLPVETNEIHLSTEQPPSPPTLSSPSCCNMILETTLNDNAAIEVLTSETLIPPKQSSITGSAVVGPRQEKRIEVCMGGKCKKMGAPALMAEFQRAVGNEGAVVGCKCLGKCKTAPNVRVLNGDQNVGDDSLRTPTNPLCIGVGLEDVEMIVANYFGEAKGLSLAVTAI